MSQGARSIIHSPGSQPGLLPVLSLIDRYQTDLARAGQPSTFLANPDSDFISILSPHGARANKAGVLLGIFITLHDHPECERWDGPNYVQYTHR